MREIWKPTENPNYAVSSEGRVQRIAGGRGATPGRIMRQRINPDGYACVHLYLNDRAKGYLVSRLVCAAFHGPAPDGDFHAAHGDGDKTNNRPDNLRWATRLENEADKELHGSVLRGERHGYAKLSEAEVLAIRDDNRPQSAIARDYNVSQSLVCMVRTRKVWAHV